MTALRALYVTDRWDGPYRYRVQQACEQLRADGAVADVVHLESPDLFEALESYGVVVLFRLPYGERVDALVRAARKVGVRLLFDVDDLIFDPRMDGLMPFRRRFSPEEWATSYGQMITNLRRTFDACDAFIGSTPELAEHARRLGKRAHVHPNVAPPAYLRAGKWAARLSRALRVQPTIGYFSGSDTHDEDFASIAPAIETVLAEYRDVRLLIVGFLELRGRHPEIEQRVVRLPYMHWRDFALAYAACHVTLAPLAIVNEFTSSKSALKFFEAGSFSTPVVATPVREMASAIEPGKTGWLARTRQDWADAVANALDPAVSARVGKAAREAVLSNHSADAHRGKLVELLSEYAVTPKGPLRAPSLLEVVDERGAASRFERALRPGRAARDLLNVVRTARREVRPELDVPALERILQQVETGSDARRLATANGAFVLRAGDGDDFRANDQVVKTGALPGESGSRGSDPSLTSPLVSVETSRYRYVVLRLRSKATTPSAKAQLYWKSGDGQPFTERAAVTFSIATDGFDRAYVVDLHRATTRAEEKTREAWQRAGVVTRFRLDPLDHRGSFRVGPIVLLPGAPALGEAPRGDVAAAPPGTFLPLTDEGKETLERALSELEPGARAAFSLGGAPGVARDVLAGWVKNRDVSVERLFESKDGAAACVLRRVVTEARPGVDIVVPVHNARALVRACLASVARHASGDYRLVIVDDASTDLALVQELDAFARENDRTVLLTNPKNLGFVGTANRGMRHAAGRDVLLLNSDTEVSEGFLEGLRDAAYSGPRVAMCSPLSNNATICSVPEFCVDNPLPLGMTLEETAALVRRSSRKLRPGLVTPHGFCLYIRADALEKLGFFDEQRFGKGFGEENDLGERAKAEGYEIVLADDVYVWHAGKASFGDEGRALERQNAAVLAERHPDYARSVATFVRENPLAAVHDVVRRNLTRRSAHLEPAPLLILHANPFADEPGGVEHCVRDLVRAVGAPRTVLLYPHGASVEVAEIIDGNIGAPSLYVFPLSSLPGRFCHDHAEALSAVAEVLSLFRIGWVHVHHLMFLPLTIGELLVDRHISYVVTVHDFYPACPSANLLDVRTDTLCCPASRCDAARTAACQRALFAKLGEPIPADPVAFVEEHRRAFRALLAGAHRVFFPAASAAKHTGELLELGGVQLEILPHGVDAPRAVASPRAGGGRAERAGARTKPVLRVALLGQIAYASKGAEAYLEVMERLRDVRVEWHVFGRTDLFDYDRRLDALGPKVTVVRHGAYRRDDIVKALGDANVDVGLLLPTWPETYSYTLTELLAARVPVVARRIGALADRLDGQGYAILVGDAIGAADALLRLERAPQALAAMRLAMTAHAGDAGTELRTPGVAEWSARHRAVYAECAAASQVHGTVSTTAAEYARLNELAVTRETPVARAVTVTGPSPEIAGTWWYKHAERAKPYVPESIRQITRRRLARDSSTAVVKFRLPGKKAVLGQQLTVERRYVGTTQLVSHGVDPFLLLSHAPLDPRSVKLLRFNMWCSTPSVVFAQLYFKHEGAAAFDEEHSITVPLNGALGQWQEYVANLEAADGARAFYDGGEIVALRFDPINVPGPIGLGELSLCSAGDRRRPA
ncbi:MAG TPA: glycosyltransferase [Polyangiaceae bacterium]|jgi:GT2 family glycosyltransferase/glycosyltransferase involved in cell wall biosynthesis|nr:glycosyltransferase [Polyangiaceae bacterium]